MVGEVVLMRENFRVERRSFQGRKADPKLDTYIGLIEIPKFAELIDSNLNVALIEDKLFIGLSLVPYKHQYLIGHDENQIFFITLASHNFRSVEDALDFLVPFRDFREKGLVTKIKRQGDLYAAEVTNKFYPSLKLATTNAQCNFGNHLFYGNIYDTGLAQDSMDYPVIVYNGTVTHKEHAPLNLELALIARPLYFD